jgi:hypothetical protein
MQHKDWLAAVGMQQLSRNSSCTQMMRRHCSPSGEAMVVYWLVQRPAPGVPQCLPLSSSTCEQHVQGHA